MGNVIVRADVRQRIRLLSNRQKVALWERIVMTLYPQTARDDDLLDAEQEWNSDNHDWLYQELCGAGPIPESREVDEKE